VKGFKSSEKELWYSARLQALRLL